VLLSLFAAIAMTVAAVGIYSVTSYLVSSRTREMGIRIAVGASGSAVQRGVLARTARVALIGIALGLAAAFWLTRLMHGLLFQTSPLDPMVLPLVAVLLAAVSLLAAWLPARRAAQVDPLVALRQE
jgi:ABC-type antimicrobial peptide transport system permease subunit